MQLTTRKVMDELASNETVLYIQKLEEETKQLKKQLKDTAAQLHTAMVSCCFCDVSTLCLIQLMSQVANAALSRKMGNASATYMETASARK